MADPITQVIQSLGLVTAYGYAKSKGYTGTEEEFEEAAAAIGQGAATAAAAAEAASEDAGTATTAAGTATTKAAEAAASALAAKDYKEYAEQAATDATTAKNAAAGSAADAAAAAQTATVCEDNADEAADAASASASDAHDYSEDSKAWAIGVKNGFPVPDTADQYNNNAKYYAEQASGEVSSAEAQATAAAASATAAAASAVSAEAWATGGSGGTAAADNNAKYYAEQASESAATLAGYEETEIRVDSITEAGEAASLDTYFTSRGITLSNDEPVIANASALRTYCIPVTPGLSYRFSIGMPATNTYYAAWMRTSHALDTFTADDCVSTFKNTTGSNPAVYQAPEGAHYCWYSVLKTDVDNLAVNRVSVKAEAMPTEITKSIADAKEEADYAANRIAQVYATDIKNSSGAIVVDGGITPNGTNTTIDTYLRTGYTAYSETLKIIVDTTDYDFIVWTYASAAVSGRKRCLTGDGYVDKSQYPWVLVPKTDGENYFRIGYKRKDGATMTDADKAAVTQATSFYVFGIEKYEEVRDLFSVGDSILPQDDMLEGTFASETDVWTTYKAAGAVYTTKAIDLGYMAGRKYAVRNIYRIYGYDSTGAYVGYKQAAAQYADDVIDFTTPHRYVRVAVNRNARNDHDVVLGSVIGSSTHRGKFASGSLNLDGNISKRAFLSPGDLGSAKYRMPFCEYTNDGVLLLGGEMRYSNGADNGEISIAFTRSFDNGKTFETPIILFERNVDPNTAYHTKSCGQFLVDRYTGRIFCFCFREDSNINRINTHTPKADYDSSILYKYSTDNGATWSTEQSIDLRTADMMIMVPSPGRGITMTDGTLVMPAWALYSDGSMYSLLVYSTDHGTTWTWSGVCVPMESTNESTVVETDTAGTLLYNCRSEDVGYRAIYTTSDLGATYTEHPANLYSLKTPIVSANMLKVEVGGGNGENVYLYSSPFAASRKDTRIVCTKDFLNWKTIANITDGQTRGYTCMAVWGDIVNIVEEFTNEYLTCDTIRIPQSCLGVAPLQVPPAANSTGAIRGSLIYNRTTGKLQFIDDTGTTRNIAFES